MKQIENQFDTILEISDIYPIIGRTSHHFKDFIHHETHPLLRQLQHLGL